MESIDSGSLAQMARRGGSWAAYENKALDSANCGHLQFLRVGEGCTYSTPPEQYPADSSHGMGWRYCYVGMVDLSTGSVTPREPQEVQVDRAPAT